ncbi:MAG: JAB domain-containing protein, partial [Candidatus Ventricola sp.]|nr:JAB domain-containing protein [Candidatus Ventricola sp.]
GRYQKSAMGERPILSNFAQAQTFCGALFFGAHDERFYIVCLDKSERVIHTEMLHRGTIDEVAVYPRPVVEIALRHHAHAVLLAHNHPGGIGEPSQEDYQATRALVAALRPVGIGVVDHLIFSGAKAHSMTMHSECGDEQPEEFSYFMRSRQVPGRRGALREGPQDGLVSLSEREL